MTQSEKESMTIFGNSQPRVRHFQKTVEFTGFPITKITNFDLRSISLVTNDQNPNKMN